MAGGGQGDANLAGKSPHQQVDLALDFFLGR
jgi:hypothetical protein